MKNYILTIPLNRSQRQRYVDSLLRQFYDDARFGTAKINELETIVTGIPGVQIS